VDSLIVKLTIADFTVGIHYTPLGSGLYYEEQKLPAKRCSKEFLANRLPKFLNYFERILDRNSANGPWMVGRRLTYVDLSMAQIITGLHYAFPAASRKYYVPVRAE
jgi:glutathione S-transferase